MKEAKQRVTKAIENSERHRSSITADAKTIQQSALSMQDKLNAALPDLARVAESAEEEDRQRAYSEYLGARQNLHRCEQAYQRARRQEAIAEAM